MPYVIFFPGQSDANPYEVATMTEVAEIVQEECESVISGLGSDGYDLIWPDEAGENVADWLDTLSELEAEDETLAAHRRGIQIGAKKLAESVMARFRIEPSEDNPVTTFALPDHTTIALTFEEDY
jgi:hypothetical protein